MYKGLRKGEIKFPRQLFSKLERSTVLLGLGRITEKRIFVSSAGQVDSTAPGGHPGQGTFMLMSLCVTSSNHILTVLQNKEFYLVFTHTHTKRRLSHFWPFRHQGTKHHPGSFVFVITKISFFKICIFIQHNKKFINNNVNKLHMNLRGKRGQIGIKKMF